MLLFLLLLLLNRNVSFLSMCQRAAWMATVAEKVMERVESEAVPEALKTGRQDVPT